MKPFSVEIICPLYPSRKENVWFNPDGIGFICNGCENSSNDATCIKCIEHMQNLHGGIQEDCMEKQLKEIFEVAQEKKQ